MLGVHWAGATWCQFAPMQFAVAASVANKVPSGVQWLKLPPNWLVVAPKIELAARKFQNV